MDSFAKRKIDNAQNQRQKRRGNEKTKINNKEFKKKKNIKIERKFSST